MPSRSLALPMLAVAVVAALAGFVGRVGSFLPILIDVRGFGLSAVVLSAELAVTLLLTVGSVAVGYLLLDGRYVADRLALTVFATTAVALLAHLLGVLAATTVLPSNISWPDSLLLMIVGALLASLVGALPVPVGVVAGGAVRRLRGRTA